MRHSLKVLIQTAISNSDVVRQSNQARRTSAVALVRPSIPTDNSGGRKLSPKTYLRRTSSRMPRKEQSQGRTRLADSVQSVVTWMRFHTKSKLRDKTPRGKQLVHALTEVGITLWQKNWRECRDCEAARTGCRTPYRIPLPRQMQHDFSENSAGRQHSRRNQVWSWEPAHWITCWFRFAQNFESPSNGKSG